MIKWRRKNIIFMNHVLRLIFWYINGQKPNLENTKSQQNAVFLRFYWTYKNHPYHFGMLWQGGNLVVFMHDVMGQAKKGQKAVFWEDVWKFRKIGPESPGLSQIIKNDKISYLLPVMGQLLCFKLGSLRTHLHRLIEGSKITLLRTSGDTFCFYHPWFIPLGCLMA